MVTIDLTLRAAAAVKRYFETKFPFDFQVKRRPKYNRARVHSVKILLAHPRGCCAGVDLALETLERTLRIFPAPIYCFHHIVHNTKVIDHFRRAGVVFVGDLNLVPQGATVVFSAHGVAPEVRGLAVSRNLRVIDATCPLVTKVHSEVLGFVRLGFTVVLIGHRGHDEVAGILGEAEEHITPVEMEMDIQRLRVADPTRVAYVTQTTLSVDDTQDLILALKARFPDAVGPAKEDICFATQNRQEAVRKLAPLADVAVVIGSANSSNSQRLAEVARSCGTPAYMVDGPEFLRPSWFKDASIALLTAGASVPEVLVRRAVDWFKANFAATVQEHPGKQELVRFQLPESVRTSDAGSPPTMNPRTL
jgi:4-hydroxy-3-methylbut-2-en-1-yl diphosphate reductase